jgi:GT2 family glycosyltransferase
VTASLDIIIVNWNSGQHLRRCLESVPAALQRGFRLGCITVVDNASRDRSAEDLPQANLPLHVIRNEENRGFAAACNQGALGSTADYLLFLNPDVLLRAESLSIPMQFMERTENQNVGVCGIQLLDPQGRLTCSCSRFPKPWEFHARMFGLDLLLPNRVPGLFLPERDHRESKQVDQVMGAFFLVRRAVFEPLHGFDEHFFVYFEDLDLSYRARQAGFNSYFLATATATHVGAGCSEQVKAARLFYLLRSRIIYGYKHFSWVAATSLLVGTVVVEPLARMTLSAAKGSFREMRETLQGFFGLWRALAGLRRGQSLDTALQSPPESDGNSGKDKATLPLVQR